MLTSNHFIDVVQAVEWETPILHRENLTDRIDLLSNRV